MIEELNRALIDFFREELGIRVEQKPYSDFTEIKEDDLPCMILMGPDIQPHRKETYAIDERDGGLTDPDPVTGAQRRPMRGPDTKVNLVFRFIVASKLQGGPSGILQMQESLVEALNTNKVLVYDGEEYEMDGYATPLAHRASRDRSNNKAIQGEIRLTDVPIESRRKWEVPVVRPGGFGVASERK